MFGKKLKAWLRRPKAPSLEERLRQYGASGERRQSFDLVMDRRLVSALFFRLAGHLREYIEDHQRRAVGQAPTLQLRTGTLPDGEGFLFLQSWNEPGYLIELSQHGWLIAEADYIAHEHRFMRSRERWEAVTIMSSSQTGAAEILLRISSSRWQGELLSYPIYFDRLCNDLPLLQALQHTSELSVSVPQDFTSMGLTTSRLKDWL